MNNKKMKTIKFLGMLLAMLALSVSFVSCSSDDDDEGGADAIYDYQIEFSMLDKGDQSSSESKEIIASLNSINTELEALTDSQAKYVFNSFVDELVDSYDTERWPDFKIKVSLKRQDGREVSNKILVFSEDGCRIG